MNIAADMLAHLGHDEQRRAIAQLSPDGKIVEPWTRRRLRSEIASWQKRLTAADLAPGDRVAIAPARHPSAAALHVALLASGLVVVPLNTALTPPEAAAVLDAADARLVIAARWFEAGVRGASAATAPWWVLDDDGAPQSDLSLASRSGVVAVSPKAARRKRLEGGRPYVFERDADEEALVIHTSGTTGNPKSVPLSHANLKHNLETLAAVWHRHESDGLLHVLPLHHYHGLVLALYGSLAVGNEVFVLPRFDARAVLDAIPRYEISLLMGVPTMYARVLDEARDGDDLSALRLAVSGSAPLGESLWRRFHARFGIELIERYGLTETGIVTSNPVHAARPGSVGLPLADMRIAIRTDDGYLTYDRGGHSRSRSAAGAGDTGARHGARGEICIAGPTVMRGYGNDREANARSFRDGYFHSGDLGFFDADGYLWVDGRIKDLIIVGGSNVVPGEVERVLSSVHEAAEVCVAGLLSSDLGEIVAAFVVARDHAEPRDVEAALRKAAEDGLAAYKRPRRYVFLRELPRNTMGKVDRAKLSRSLR